MARHINGILILGFTLCATATGAQRRTPPAPQPQSPVRATRTDTTIKGTTLDVYQVYQPELKPIVKPELSPTLPPVVKEPTPQQYDVPQQTLNYSYRSMPLRPLALGKDTGALPAQNYALLGGGNLSTILTELGLGSLHGANWNAAVQGRYLRQDGALEAQVYRSFFLRGTGSYKTETHLLDAGLNVSRNVFGRYGYDHDVLNYKLDDVRMVYSAADIMLGLQNRQPGIWGIEYHPTIGIGAFDATQGHETTLNISLPVRKQIDSSLSLQIALNAALAWTTIGNVSGSNNIVQFAPALHFRRGGFSAHVGIYPTLGRVSPIDSFRENPPVQLLPDIHAAYHLLDNKLSFSAGWQAQRLQNTLQQLTRSNPYLMPDSNARVQTLRKEIFAAGNLAIGQHMNVWGRIARQRFELLPLFVTKYGSDGKDFVLLSDYVTAFVWGGGIRYAIGDDFSLGAEGLWYNYYEQGFYSHPYGEPAVRLKGDAKWQITEGLLLTTYAEVLDKIWGRNAAGQDVEHRGVFDLGAAGEYSFVSRFSVFLRADNLLGRKNERWLGYPSFGFNIYGGLRFRF